MAALHEWRGCFLWQGRVMLDCKRAVQTRDGSRGWGGPGGQVTCMLLKTERGFNTNCHPCLRGCSSPVNMFKEMGRGGVSNSITFFPSGKGSMMRWSDIKLTPCAKYARICTRCKFLCSQYQLSRQKLYVTGSVWGKRLNKVL